MTIYNLKTFQNEWLEKEKDRIVNTLLLTVSNLTSMKPNIEELSTTYSVLAECHYSLSGSDMQNSWIHGIFVKSKTLIENCYIKYRKHSPFDFRTFCPLSEFNDLISQLLYNISSMLEDKSDIKVTSATTLNIFDFSYEVHNDVVAQLVSGGYV